jgi:hypothetical protein
VKTPQLLWLAWLISAALMLVALMVAARDRAQRSARAERQRTLELLRAYPGEGSDAQRAPVDYLAIRTLDAQLPRPDEDPELAAAALAVVRRGSNWFAISPDIAGRIKGWLDTRLAEPQVDGGRLKSAYDLLVQAECAEAEDYRARIAALAGDRTRQGEVLGAAATRLRQGAGTFAGQPALAEVLAAWRDLHDIRGGRLNWAAQAVPSIAQAEHEAVEAVAVHLRALLVPYGVNAASRDQRGAPDSDALAWFEQRAGELERSQPVQRYYLSQVRDALAEMAPEHGFEPAETAACVAALRQHTVPWSGRLVGLAVLLALGGGLAYAVVRLLRGPRPVDVNAETMENVEPIDLDTDAETRSKTRHSLTNVG